jgi:predicted MFS family arabinose efflux permease
MAMFAVGTDGFVIAGLLPALATDLDITIPVAGQLVTVFAITLAVAAPVLGAATSHLDQRTVLLLGLSGFTVGNVLTALAPTYPLVFAARMATAAGAGLIGAAAFASAAGIAPPQRRGTALAVVMGGLTSSTALGLPIGTLIGSGNWRITLWAVAGSGLVAAAGVALGVPRIPPTAAPLRQRLAPLRDRWVLGVLAATALTLTGIHVLYTYLAAATAETTAGSPALFTLVLAIWGLGTVAGTIVVGPAIDRFTAERVLVVGLLGMAAVLAATPLVLGDLTATLIWVALWGFCVGLPVVPQQHRLTAHAPAAVPVLIGLASSAIYAGVAAGGALGGLAQLWITPELLGLLGAVLVAAALLLTIRPKAQAGSDFAEQRLSGDAR